MTIALTGVSKFTWLFDCIDFELSGTVQSWLADSDNTGDGFHLDPEQGIKSLVSSYVFGIPGLFHCETYPLDPAQVNRGDTFAPRGIANFQQKPLGTVFMKVMADGTNSQLNLGDRIAFRARLVVENGHPNPPYDQMGDTYPPLPIAGRVWIELHPFDWQALRYVQPPVASDDLVSGMMIAVAPLYEMSFAVPSGDPMWWGNKVRGWDPAIYVDTTGSMYHNTVQANASFAGPPLPVGIDFTMAQLAYQETVILNGTGQTIDAVRQIQVSNGIVAVSSSVTSPARWQFGNTPVGDWSDPANNRSILATHYAVSWSSIWADDRLPDGSAADGNEPFNWISSNPAPYSGLLAHDSPAAAGVHQHLFVGATTQLVPLNNVNMFAHVWIDPAAPPTELMLQWYVGDWEHRAYWGTDSTGFGTDGTASRLRVGDLPAAGQWVRLEVPAQAVGVTNSLITGMAFTAADGRAVWDVAGWLIPLAAGTCEMLATQLADLRPQLATLDALRSGPTFAAGSNPVADTAIAARAQSLRALADAIQSRQRQLGCS